MESLVKVLNLAVLGAERQLRQTYPALLTILSKSSHPSSDWRFFMTAGGVGMYLLINKVGEKEEKEIMDQLIGRDRQEMIYAIDNLSTYLKTRKNMKLDTQTIQQVIGFWVLWNIAGDPPTMEECKGLAPAIGMFLYNIVTNL